VPHVVGALGGCEERNDGNSANRAYTDSIYGHITVRFGQIDARFDRKLDGFIDTQSRLDQLAHCAGENSPSCAIK
jgi:hypothetical protein